MVEYETIRLGAKMLYDTTEWAAHTWRDKSQTSDLNQPLGYSTRMVPEPLTKVKMFLPKEEMVDEEEEDEIGPKRKSPYDMVEVFANRKKIFLKKKKEENMGWVPTGLVTVKKYRKLEDIMINAPTYGLTYSYLLYNILPANDIGRWHYINILHCDIEIQLSKTYTDSEAFQVCPYAICSYCPREREDFTFNDAINFRDCWLLKAGGKDFHSQTNKFSFTPILRDKKPPVLISNLGALDCGCLYFRSSQDWGSGAVKMGILFTELTVALTE